MLVHSFSQKHKRFNEYAAFVRLFGKEAVPDSIVYVGERAGKHLYLGWVTGERECLKK